MSSILAALLHHVKDRKLYFLYRLAVGQQILANFLEKSMIPENMNYLEHLLSDGYKLFGRKIFSSIPSSLANFAAQYLEELHPEVFKNSILIGSGHSKWLLNKKQAAIEILNGDRVSFELLKLTVDLGINVRSMLDFIPYDSKSTDIVIEEDLRDSALTYSVSQKDFYIMGALKTTNADTLS